MWFLGVRLHQLAVVILGQEWVVFEQQRFYQISLLLYMSMGTACGYKLQS